MDTFGTGVDIESKRFVFNLKSKEVTRVRPREKVVFAILAEGHTGVVADNCASVDQFVGGLTSCRVKLPKGHLALTSNCELVVCGVSSFVVFRETTP